MSGADTLQQKLKRHFLSLPGKRAYAGQRGKGWIPAHIYDRIYPVANGITQQIWGDHPTPEQMQALFDAGYHTPDKIHEAYNALPHPHAPNVTVGQYPAYANAVRVYEEHRR